MPVAEASVERRTVIRYENGAVRRMDDEIAAEWPVTIMLNGEELMTMVCTPDYVEDLAVGYLASEGLLREIGDLRDIAYDDNTGTLYADIDGVDAWLRESGSRRAWTSCCGKSRQSFVFTGDASIVTKVETRRVRATVADCLAMMEQLQRQSVMFRSTGGVHNAALFAAEGGDGGSIGVAGAESVAVSGRAAVGERWTMLLSRHDIGRHNAIDKIYGHCLRDGIATGGRVLAFSGRVSSEVLIKAAKMGVELVLSKSAVTALAIDLAEELGITIVGFIRGGSCNVYTHAERLAGAEVARDAAL